MGKQKNVLSTALLVGLGLAFLTRDKIESAVNDFMQAEGVSKDDAKKALQDVLAKANAHRVHVEKEIKNTVEKTIKEISNMANQAKKATSKKVVAKKAPAKKVAAKKPAAKKVAVKKAVVKKAAPKKAAPKKAAPKKAAPKKAAPKKAVVKKAPAKKKK